MLTPSYDALRLFQSKFSSITDFQGFNRLLKETNLKAQMLLGDMILSFPALQLDGLDGLDACITISSNIRELCKIDLMPLPGTFTLADWERMLIGSLKAGLKEL